MTAATTYCYIIRGEVKFMKTVFTYYLRDTAEKKMHFK